MLPSTLPAASTLLDLGHAAQGGPPAGPPFVALRPLRGGSAHQTRSNFDDRGMLVRASVLSEAS